MQGRAGASWPRPVLRQASTLTVPAAGRSHSSRGRLANYLSGTSITQWAKPPWASSNDSWWKVGLICEWLT
jgi:hypothetical protein